MANNIISQLLAPKDPNKKKITLTSIFKNSIEQNKAKPENLIYTKDHNYKPSNLPYTGDPNANKPVSYTDAKNEPSANITSTDTINYFDVVTGKLSPTQQSINSLLKSIQDSIANPAKYDPNTDTSYQMFMTEAAKQADRAYKDTNAEYLGNQSGNFNSAAQQIASTAKNELLTQALLQQPQFEDRFYNRQQQNLSNTYDIVNALLGIENMNYNRAYQAERDAYQAKRDLISDTGRLSYEDILSSIPEDSPLRNIEDYSIAISKETDPWRRAQLEALRYEKIQNDPKLKEKYGATAVIPTYITRDAQSDLYNQAYVIARANYDNIQAEINRRAALNPNDPLIPYLQAIRQDKIEAQQAAEAKAAQARTEAEQRAYENALKVWQTSGVATPDIASILGVPVGAKTADYDISSINAAIGKMNAETSRMNAQTNRMNAQTNAYQAQTSRMSTQNAASNRATQQKQDEVKRYSDYIDSVFMSPVQVGTDLYGEPIFSSQKTITEADRARLEQYLVQLLESGVSADVVDTLAAKYGV